MDDQALGRESMTQERRWWRDPAVHFILIGTFLVLVQMLATPVTGQRSIVVPGEVVRGLRAEFARRTGALPTPQEETGLIEDFIRNETLYREALALGLDKGDVVVRRRLIQKMQFLLEDEEPLREPTQSELENYLLANATRYERPARVAISHVFVASDRHADPRAAAQELAAEIDGRHTPGELGDPFLRGREFPLFSQSSLAGIFGANLAAEVMNLPVGTWSPPIRSSYGYHLVLVRERQSSRPPSVAEAETQLRRDWRADARREVNERALARLRGAYDVRVESEAGA
jgi:hypothetical protein